MHRYRIDNLRPDGSWTYTGESFSLPETASAKAAGMTREGPEWLPHRVVDTLTGEALNAYGAGGGPMGSRDGLSAVPLTLKVRRLTPTAKLPTKAFPDDAGWDIYSDVDQSLEGPLASIRTGIAVEIPPGWFGLILGRSSMAGWGIDVLGGCIDSGYRGEWLVVLLSKCGGAIRRGDKVAQFVVLPVPEVEVVEVDALGETARGPRGFGSTGK